MKNQNQARRVLISKIFGLVAVSEFAIMVVLDYLSVPENIANILDPILLTFIISFPLWLMLQKSIQIKGTELKKEFQSREAYLLQRLKAIDTVGIVSITNSQGVITYANDNFLKISGYKSDELVGKTHSVVNSGVHPKVFWKEVWATLLAGQPWRGDVCNRAKDGSLYWVQANILPLYDTEGKVNEYISIRFDITAQKELEVAYEREKVVLLEKSRMAFLTQLAGGVAHEINNPLAIIQGKISSALRKSANGLYEANSLRADLQKISEVGGRIEKIVKGLRALEGLGFTELVEPHAILEIINLSLDFLRERLQDAKVELRINIPADIFISCRSKDLSYAFTNIFLNAYEAVSHQTERWISVEAKTFVKSVVILISDSGPGIPMEIRKKIGTPFFTTKEVGKGMGVGLSISRGIIESHGGTLVLDEKTEAALFEIRLPIKMGVQLDILDASEAISSHLAWKQKLINLSLKNTDLVQADALRSGEDSALGVWIEQKLKLEPQNPTLLELSEVHKKIHLLAADLVSRLQNGESPSHELFVDSNSDFAKCSSQIILLLEQISEDAKAMVSSG